MGAQVLGPYDLDQALPPLYRAGAGLRVGPSSILVSQLYNALICCFTLKCF